MSTAPPISELVMVVSGGNRWEPSVHAVAAAVRGGGLGVVELSTGDRRALDIVEQCARRATGHIGVRVGAECAASPAELEAVGHGRIDLIVLTADAPWPAASLVARYRVLVEVTSLQEARAAAEAGAHGLIARGMESGGRVSPLSAFVLLQQLLGDASGTLPVWVAGGIGPRTAVACVVGGAAGVVLDSQLALMPESMMSDDAQAAVRRMDGSEVVSIGQTRGLPLGGDREDPAALLAIGQDGWLAAAFRRRWPDTAAAVRGLVRAVTTAVTADAPGDPLLPGSDLARTLGVTLPIAQGPMTRVSDEAGFAAAVSAEGGLPFIALALADGQTSRHLLTRAAAALGDRPWGVGVLGFAPDQLRTAQLDAIREVRPTCAIIAGGRPAQAKGLEAEGISTFLHVPSPGLLRQFLQAGARKFIFEGAECGGHVGPRASFSLWEGQLEVLEEFLDGRPAGTAAEIQVFFAGGVHDERSAAMVAAMAAPLTRSGVQVGLLMGTAYLFTAEAVTHGAIQPVFQEQAVAATHTAVLETAPGHVTRCLPSPFVADFHQLRDELRTLGVENREVWERLELMNVGRLRIASKGRRRDGDRLVEVDRATQTAEGLFMAGQVAVLRADTSTVAELHRQVTTAASAFLRDRVDHLRAALGVTAPAGPARRRPPLDIAIVGMACVFPQAPDLESYWKMILGGEDAITEVPADRWDVDHYYAAEVPPGQTGRISVSKWGGFIDPVPFDAIRYGIPPAALSSIDPTQLLALEISHRALIDAGYPYDAAGVDHSRTGVVFGAEAGSDMGHAQTLRTMLPAYLGEVPEAMQEMLPTITEDSFPGVLANVIAGRVANRLDLGGPNFTVDAACASSLAAMDAACKELASGESDLMICGGADLHNGINDFLMFTSAHALSPTGRSRPFDSTGDGIALGEGVACVVLKRLADAERDGDRVYAVIKGVGGASDGRALGLTAPRAEGQRRALDRAYDRAGIAPSQVGLVEAHGTGTAVGDRTELQTLTRLFTEAGARPGSSVLGSVKSQIGHTKCAAGMAGVIKAALALHTGVKPPTVHLSRPNPAWDPQTSPFAFHTEARPWAAPAAERIAGVSAFGFGGTNFHVVLGAHAATADPRHASRQWPAELFCFRGVDRAAARRSVRALLDTVTGTTRPLRELAAAASAASDPRSGPVRIAVVAANLADLSALLHRALAGEHDPRKGLIQPPESPAEGPGKVAFLFPGQGSQRPGALAELFVAFPELRHYLDLGREWADLLFPPTAFDEQTERAQQDALRDTRAAQPVLGIGGLAVDHLLRRLGVRPDMTGGHSYGELVALCVAGAFDPATLLDLSRERAAAILAAAGSDPGTMAAVTGTAEQVAAELATAGLTGDVVLANHNTPTQVVISGPTPAVDRAVTALKGAGLRARTIPVACAFHSPVVAGGARTFGAALAGRPVAAPTLPVWSNRTAAVYPAEPDAVRAGLAAQIGAPVRFVEQLEAMYADGARIFVEAGPGQVLSGLVRAVLGERPHLVVTCDGRPGQGLRALLTAAGELACAGVAVQTGWLFRGREAVPGAAVAPGRPVWTVDGQLVRDRDGQYLRGGMTPPRRIEELSMNAGNETAGSGRDIRGELLSEYLRTSRELIATQRDVMLAYLADGQGSGPGGRLVWQPTEQAPVRAELAPVQYGTPNGLSPVPATVATTVAASVAPVPQPSHATPAVAPARPTAALPAAGGAVVALDVQGAVLSVISDRTGYPVELIELDLDLEADLSVDSIKRAEVAGEVANRLSLSVDGDESELEDLVKARTVRAMVQWLDLRINAATAPQAAPPTQPAQQLTTAAPTTPAQATMVAPATTVGVAPQRLLRRLVPATGAAGADLAGVQALITGESPVAAHLARLLDELGAGGATGSIDRAPDGADAVIMLDGLSEGAAPLLPDLFEFLQQTLATGPRWLLAVGRRSGGPRTDGLPGLFRTIAREYPHVTVRYVEVDDATPDAEVARVVVAELSLTASDPVVDRGAGQRHVEELTPVGLGALADGGAGPAGDGVAEAQALGLDQDSVVVLVGGARGITPWFARALAAAGRCRIELVGRTPMPESTEAPDLAAAADKAALRAALARRGMRSPAEIERTAKDVLAAREVTATLAELTELGSTVRYHSLDVRDEEATHQLIKEIHDTYGRIDGVVYAAGVIEDKLLAEKDPASFARVFGTKVDGARAVLEALGDAACAPRFVVLFGSIAAAYGNRGQSDYAAANDALDAMGTRWSHATGHRCLTVHWGPWAPVGGHTGMVTPELTSEYARRGIGLIDPEEGALSLLRELAWGDAAVTSVVYTASGW